MEKTSNEHFAKENDIVDQAHAMSVYDEDAAARLYKEDHFQGILGSIAGKKQDEFLQKER